MPLSKGAYYLELREPGLVSFSATPTQVAQLT